MEPMKAFRWSLVKYAILKYLPYVLGGLFFASIFLIWWLGQLLGFSSLGSLLTGIGVFLVLSLGYVLLLYRGIGQQQQLEHLLLDEADREVLDASPQDREEVGLLREQLLQAVERLNKQKGKRHGVNQDALYQLPWYMIIGQPAAGKSTMVYQSGLNFPFADREQARVAGMGGTRHCDWFFSADAILLDTAGRYMDHEGDGGKWKAFLSLLRSHRPRCPLNGLIVAVNIQDVISGTTQSREQLAKQLRERIQEARERLEASLPIYLVFTKCDLIEGFTDFFSHLSADQKAEVLGHTFPHEGHETVDWSEQFEQAFARLRQRWEAIGEYNLAHRDVRDTREDPASWHFPLEFSTLESPLQQFVTMLTNDNPYQAEPLLRGFYFVSALQEGAATLGPWAQTVHQRFSLRRDRGDGASARQEKPFFIHELFSEVIIPDQHLISRYAHHDDERRRKRHWLTAASVATLALCSAWSVSAWRNHHELRQLDQQIDHAQASDANFSGSYAPWATLDVLRQAASRYDQRHFVQDEVPWSLGFGLYQGLDVEQAVRHRYFSALEPVMLAPLSHNLTQSLYTLTTVKVYQRNTDRLEEVSIDSVAQYAEPEDNQPRALAEFGRQTLDTYEMLSTTPRDEVDARFLTQHIPAFWYLDLEARTPNPKTLERTLDLAGPQVAFYSQQLSRPDVPRINGNAFLITSIRNYIDSLLEQSLTRPQTIMLGSDTLFAFGQGDYAGLQAAGRQELNAVAQQLMNTQNLGEVVITGHADRLGSAEVNRRLSLERAQTVRQYLVGRGIPSGLIQADGEGSQRPLVTCQDNLSRTQLIKCLAPNRRVEIEIHKQ